MHDACACSCQYPPGRAGRFAVDQSCIMLYISRSRQMHRNVTQKVFYFCSLFFLFPFTVVSLANVPPSRSASLSLFITSERRLQFYYLTTIFTHDYATCKRTVLVCVDPTQPGGRAQDSADAVRSPHGAGLISHHLDLFPFFPLPLFTAGGGGGE